jgi:hypothetical protein
MRAELKTRNGQRARFTGVFERFGEKRNFGYVKRTLLLKDICDENGNPVTDHLWFNLTKGFGALALQPGDRVQFFARVKPYIKGYQGWRDDIFDKPVAKDYKLSHPTRLEKME